MGLKEEYDRVYIGKEIEGYKVELNKYNVKIKEIYNRLVALKITYPEDTVELDVYISDLQTLLGNLITYCGD